MGLPSPKLLGNGESYCAGAVCDGDGGCPCAQARQDGGGKVLGALGVGDLGLGGRLIAAGRRDLAHPRLPGASNHLREGSWTAVDRRARPEARAGAAAQAAR